jgi:hypothetical protein
MAFAKGYTQPGYIYNEREREREMTSGAERVVVAM